MLSENASNPSTNLIFLLNFHNNFKNICQQSLKFYTQINTRKLGYGYNLSKLFSIIENKKNKKDKFDSRKFLILKNIRNTKITILERITIFF